MNLHYSKTLLPAALGLGAALLLQAPAFGGGGGGGRGGGGGGGGGLGGLGGLTIGVGGGGGAGGGRTGSRSTTSYSAPGEVGDATISIDPETRSLIVIADPRTRKYIQDVLKQLDQPKPQVQINVVFVEVTHNKNLDIGIDMGTAKNIGNDQSFNASSVLGASSLGAATNITANIFGQPTSAFQPTPPGAGFTQILGQNYQATLRAIAQNGHAKVLSRPQVTVLNNQPATINIGQSVPLITSVRFDNYGNAINSVSYTTVGIILQVTPFITEDGLVEMIVVPQVSDLVQDRSQWVSISSGSAGNAAAPLINTRSADTVVISPDGMTSMIGGLMQDSKANSESKIPFLGDIPILGTLFKRTTKTDIQTELLIFLTPHVIKRPADWATLTQIERAKSPASKGMSEQEVNQYLDKLPMAKQPSYSDVMGSPNK